jgi:hypothetical protein
MSVCLTRGAGRDFHWPPTISGHFSAFSQSQKKETGVGERGRHREKERAQEIMRVCVMVMVLLAHDDDCTRRKLDITFSLSIISQILLVASQNSLQVHACDCDCE